MTALAILVLVLLASVLQRITGMGAAMMMAPFLVVMLGPHGGVMLTNVLAGCISAVMLASVWRRIEWRRLTLLIPAAVLVMPLASWIAARSPGGPLYIIVSCLVLVGLTLAVFLSRLGRRADGPAVRILTGVGAGAGTVLAGVGGPAMAFYQVLSGWDPRAFAASVQPVWITLSICGLGSKLLFSREEFPTLPWWGWLACLPLTLGGLRIGRRVGRRLSTRTASRIVVGIAVIGALLSLVTGIVALLR